MREVSIKVLKYDELSDRAKENARQNYAASEGYLHGDEALESIKKLAEHFGGKVTNYEIDWSGACSPSSMKFDMPDYENGFDATDYENGEAEIERRLGLLGEYNPETLKGHGECVLTGVCYDEDAIDGFRKAWHEGERDIDKLMEAAFRSLLEQCESEYNCFYDDEDGEFGEHCDANEYEFYESGKFYPRGK